MSIVQSDVTDFAPELATKLGAGAWAPLLAYVNKVDLASLECYPDDAETAKLAQIYLAAHMATMTWRAGNGAAGPVTGESAGGLRRSFGLIAMTGSGAFGSTRYGQMFLQLLSMSAVAGPWVI